MVPQATDTLISSFQAAVSAQQGPDIASQWATGPVLTQVWQDAVSPISDFVPKSETDQWLNTTENTLDGKLWAMPMYLIGIVVAYNKELFEMVGLDPDAPPQTSEEFLSACENLKGAGITPFNIGNQDGYGGAWFFANMELQNLDSLGEWVDAVAQGTVLSEAKYTGWYESLDEMVKQGYFNKSVNSLKLDQGHAIFSRGESAMSLGTDGIVGQWQKDLGADKVGVMKFPKFGEGKLADCFNATQSISYFICKWSKNKEEAATSSASCTALSARSAGTNSRASAWRTSASTRPSSRALAQADVRVGDHRSPGMVGELQPGAGRLRGEHPGGAADLLPEWIPLEASQLWVQVARRWQTQQPEHTDWQSWQPAEPTGA